MDTLERMKKIRRRLDIPAFLRERNLRGTIIEIGVRYGYHLNSLLSADPKLMVAVDHWRAGSEQDTNLKQGELDQLYRDVCRRTMHDSRVKILRMPSKEAVGLFDLFSVDLVYVDASHTLEGCMQDMELWWPKVRHGGVLAGHDYIESEARDGSQFGVIQAVAQFMGRKKIRKDALHSTKIGWRTWMILKEEGE